MARGARPGETLQYLVDAGRELVGAEAVVIRLQADALGLWGQFESNAASGLSPQSVPQIRKEIRSAGEPPLGELDIAWSDQHRQPTTLDNAVATRLSIMALIVLERHLAKRRQLQAVAHEREAFAGEVHDDPVQVMTAVSLQLQRVVTRMPDGEDRSAIQAARSLNDNAIERLRHVMFSLHPTTLAEDGLATSIEAYCESFVEIEGLQWQVTGDCDVAIPIEVAELGFRLCRNAIVNVVEHAEASQVNIDVSCTDDLLRVEVADDGIGFDMAQVHHPRVGHLGIPHAVTLASWVEGTYVTESEPGKGTTVVIDLPIL